MAQPGPLPLAGAGHPGAGSAGGSFSYHCNRCNRCCRDRRIQVNPYEVLRLARNCGLTTGEVVERHVDTERMALRRRSDGTCVFLGSSGCTVHADRPLACRLYPLGRIVRGSDETWVLLPPADGSEGVRGTTGEVKSYVGKQGAIPYMRAADAYHGVVERALMAGCADETNRNDGSAGRWLLDVDACVETTGEPDVDLALHLDFLENMRATGGTSAWQS